MLKWKYKTGSLWLKNFIYPSVMGTGKCTGPITIIQQQKMYEKQQRLPWSTNTLQYINLIFMHNKICCHDNLSIVNATCILFTSQSAYMDVQK